MHVESKPIRLSSTAKFITVAIIIALTILLIRGVSTILAPFIAAVITAYLFNPLITFLNRRTGFSRAIWIGLLYVAIGGLIYGLLSFLGPILTRQYLDVRDRLIPDMIVELQQLASSETIELVGITINVSELEAPVLDFLNEISRSLPERLPHLVFTALESVVLFVTFLIVAFYLLLQTEQIVEKCYGLVPAPYREEIRGLGRRVDEILGGYIRGTLLLIPIMSVLTYITLTILDVRYALVIAIATGFLEVIPLIGPWSAAGIAMTVALFQATAPFGWPNWVLALVVGAIYFILRMFEDNFIIPHVVGHAVHLHPVLVLFAILAGGALGGPFGLLISIPVAAVARLLLRYIYRKLIDAPDLPPSDISPPSRSERVAQREPTASPPRVATRGAEEPVHAD
ncbi:MAG TPA: AI-2E family transporter [Roseiflexaceae bacterium]|nr:AI-2E family transporter [Roseiflexaceae bacterium]